MATWEGDVIPEWKVDSLGVIGKVVIIIRIIIHLSLAVSLILVLVRDLHPEKNKLIVLFSEETDASRG